MMRTIFLWFLAGAGGGALYVWLRRRGSGYEFASLEFALVVLSTGVVGAALQISRLRRQGRLTAQQAVSPYWLLAAATMIAMVVTAIAVATENSLLAIAFGAALAWLTFGALPLWTCALRCSATKACLVCGSRRSRCGRLLDLRLSIRDAELTAVAAPRS